MPKKIDLIGQRFSRLIVVREAPPRKRETRWLCRCDCGREKDIGAAHLRNGKTRSCGCLMREVRVSLGSRGEKHFNWKGGRQRTDKGYVRLTRPIFPGSDRTASETALEHVVVMSRHLERPLYKGETVHHKNGIRDDNDLKNLELRASQHGPGQRVEDLVVWAKEILARYETPIISPCCI